MYNHPLFVGEVFDVLFFPVIFPGTKLAATEFLEPDNAVVRRYNLGIFELVVFTKISYEQTTNPEPAFNIIERRVYSTLKKIEFYAFEVVINPWKHVKYRLMKKKMRI